MYSYEYTASKTHDEKSNDEKSNDEKSNDEKSNDEDDDDADEDIHFDLAQQVEVCEKIDEGSDAKGSDAAVVVLRKNMRVRLIVDSK